MYIEESVYENCLSKISNESLKITEEINLINLLMQELIDEKKWKGQTRDAINEKYIILKKMTEEIPESLKEKNEFLRKTLEAYKTHDEMIDKSSTELLS